MQPDIVLSISLTHDSGSAIFVNGKLIAAIGEERLNRIKQTNVFPELSIKKVINLAGIRERDVQLVLVGSKIPPDWIGLLAPIFRKSESTDVFSRSIPRVVREQIFARKSGFMHFECSLIGLYIKHKLKESGITAPIKILDHHLSHSYSAYSSASFDHSLVVSMDAMGDGLSCSVSLGDDGLLKRVESMNGFYSPGWIYSQVTQLMGFRPGWHEGKITGLAAYGEPYKCEHLFRKLMGYKNQRFDIKIITDNDHALYREIMKFEKEDIAAGLQYVFEDLIVSFISDMANKYSRKRIALAGGIFANVKLNQRLHEIPGVEEIFIFPNMGDGGLPVGAGYAFFKKRPSCMESIYAGDSYTGAEIESVLIKSGLPYRRHPDIELKTAKCLADGDVVARFAGRMEYGPRALGNRSILYKTTDKTVNDWLNKKLKRTEFMPFAPSTLADCASNYYIGIKGAELAAKYMTITFKCTEESGKKQPACVHVDNTARPQIVAKEDNPSFYKVISHYYQETGIGSILNTSFNVHEEPIVHSPEDAIKTYLQCGLDVLVLEDFMVKRDRK